MSRDLRDRPRRVFLRIGEVAARVGVAPHVLRAWEREYGVLQPMKTRGSHRQYRPRDVELALRIRHLLEVEKLAPSGVKARLVERHSAHPDLLGGLTAALRELTTALELLSMPTRTSVRLRPVVEPPVLAARRVRDGA